MARLLAQLQLGAEPIQGAGVLGTAGSGAPDQVATSFTTQISNLIGTVTLVGGLFFLIYLLMAGFDWLTAGGDSGKVDKAKTKMTNAAIGLLVIIVGIGIAGLVGGVFGLDVLNPAATYLQLIPGGS